MSTIVVSTTFTTEWDTDDFRQQWNEPDLTDEEILAECIASVETDYQEHALDPATINVQGEIVE
jgi:hypothetical protein